MTSCLNLSGDESPECPLCMEFLELDDINFYPCTCLYQICRFCWNKLRTEGNGLCPACRQAYSENPADFKPLTSEEMAKIKAEKRQKDQAKKQKISENRKHLANVRVVQKNLVFVVGLSPRLADPEILRKPDYFGKFGKIHKVVINHSTQYAGSQIQGPSASAYVTYFKSEDALRAIQAVNNIFIDGRTLKASLGTTKYCSHFMKNQTCPKNDCMYLHELGDDLASFTKEQMQQGKHTEYEKNLHEEMLAGLALNPPSPIEGAGEGGERRGGADEDGGEWVRSSPGEYPAAGDWGSGGGRAGTSGSSAGGGETDWGGRVGSQGGGDHSWPDLGPAPMSNYGKGRFISSNSKDDDKSSKSKSCESSEEDSGSLPPDCLEDQVVPCPEPVCVPPASLPPPSLPPPSTLPSLGSLTPARVPRSIQSSSLSQSSHPQPSHSQPSYSQSSYSQSSHSQPIHSQPPHSQPSHSQPSHTQPSHPQPSQPTQPSLPAQIEQRNNSTESGWLDELKTSNSFVDDDVDDLGFDPFHETQKGLADLLESEAAEAQQSYKAPSPEPDWAVPGPSTTRARLPPPGFHTTQPHPQPQNHLGSYLQNPVDSLFGPAPSRGRGGAPGFGAPTSPHDLMFGLGKEQGGLGRLGLGEQNKLMGLGGESNQQSRLLQGHTMQGGLGDGFSSKDWQDGLRALLPNVNVSFGGGQNHGSSGLGNGGGPGLGGNMSGGLGGLIQSLGPPGGHYGLQNSYQNSYSQDRGQQQQQQQQHNSNWGSSINSNGMGGNDWTMLDPAIVTGQLSGPHPDYGQQSAGIRSDSPPNWIRDNLEQLTAEPNSSPYSAHGGQGLSHAFNGLGLGAGQARRGMGGWGGGATTATPPPGFSHHRQPLAQQGYQGFKAAQEGPKIGDFN